MTLRILHICRIFLQAILLVIFFLFFGLPAIRRFQAREVLILKLIKLLCGSFISQDCFRDIAKKKNGKMWEFFPSRGPPLPPVWDFFPDFPVYFWEVSHVKNSKKNGSGIRVDPPPPVFSKFPHFPVFFFGNVP